MRKLANIACLTATTLSVASAQPYQTPILQISPVHYELDVRVDYEEETIAGIARITLTNHTDEAAPEISLLLYRLMRVDTLFLAGRGELSYTQQVVSYDDFPKLQVNHIVAVLDPPMAPGDKLTVEIGYGGHLLGYAETGMRYIQDHVSPDFTILRDDARAFPQPGYPAWAVNSAAPRPAYDYLAHITVPDSLTVANGGELVEVLKEEGKSTYVYRSLRPSWRMDFAIARYATINAQPIRIFHFVEDSVGARAVADAAAAAFETFESWFGPLADTTTLTFIEIPDGWGSQTDATAIIQSAAAFRDTSRHHEVFHELSHLWNVPPTDLPSPRWNEGLASFLEYLVTETITGRHAVTPRMNFLMKWLRDTLPSRESWPTIPLVRYGEEGMTGLSYRVGALFFDQLYRMLGTDEFHDLIGEYYRRYNVSGGSTDDLVRLVRDRGGTRADALIEDWLFTTHWTELVVQFDTAQELADHYASGIAD
jgi:hypothetical protein